MSWFSTQTSTWLSEITFPTNIWACHALLRWSPQLSHDFLLHLAISMAQRSLICSNTLLLAGHVLQHCENSEHSTTGIKPSILCKCALSSDLTFTPASAPTHHLLVSAETLLIFFKSLSKLTPPESSSDNNNSCYLLSH